MGDQGARGRTCAARLPVGYDLLLVAEGGEEDDDAVGHGRGKGEEQPAQLVEERGRRARAEGELQRRAW